jgi:glycerol-3-phosphate acyltransferase PlsY
LRAFLVILVAYVIGSIPFGYLIVRARVGADIRETGSGGTGATNVSRRVGKIAGLLTLLLDAAKGAIATLLARHWVATDDQLTLTVSLAAVAVIVGHIFPIWLGFRGGKGVATAIGVFLVLAPIAVASAGIIFVAVLLLTRYVSLSSMLAVLAIPLFVWLRIQFGCGLQDSTLLLSVGVAVAGIVVFAHRANISRLMKGTENKFR